MRLVRILSGLGAVVLSAGLMAGLARGENVAKSAPGSKFQNPKSPALTAKEKTSARDGSETNILPLTVELRQELVPGFPPATRVMASAGTNKFTFLAPRGFRVNASDPKKIILVYSNQTTFITMRLWRPPSAPTGDVKTKSLPEKYRERLLAEHPGEQVRSEFSRSVDGHAGPAYDVQWVASGGSVQSARVVFVPTPKGVLEFRMKAAPDRFHAATYKFNNVLLSFRASRNGKLEIAPLSNKF